MNTNKVEDRIWTAIGLICGAYIVVGAVVSMVF